MRFLANLQSTKPGLNVGLAESGKLLMMPECLLALTWLSESGDIRHLGPLSPISRATAQVV